jgi:PAT family acetyl-CoA transporter-like MFS transporter 1
MNHRQESPSPPKNSSDEDSPQAEMTQNIEHSDAGEGPKEYTTILFNIKTDFCWSILVLITLFFQFGILLGYLISLTIYIQTLGSSYKQQAALSVIFYPFAMKILVAPFIDSTFIASIGKSKTYILFAGITNTILI